MKYEHDFINQWLEYHIKIGFSHFYLIIDNFLDEQPIYPIDKQFNNYVSLFYLTNNTEYKNICHADLMHEMVNKLIIEKKTIKEDWVTCIGIDQFIYLDNNNIQLSLQDIDDDCSQIIMPWSICFHNNNITNYENLLENIDLYDSTVVNPWGPQGHSNGMIRTKDMSKFNSDSHSFISNKDQKIFIMNEYFKFKKDLGYHGVFEIVKEKIKNNITLNFTTCHFLLRNTMDIIIKSSFYGWCHSEIIKITEIIESIKNKDKLLYVASHRKSIGKIKNLMKKIKFNYKFYLDNYPDLRHLDYESAFKHYLDYGEKEGRLINKENYIEFNIPNLQFKNTETYYINIILNKLNENGFTISKENLKEWINSLII